MNLEEIKALQPKEKIEELMKGRVTEMPDLKNILKAIDVKKHSIFDKTLRADKIIKTDDGSTKVESVARIGFALQKLIVKRAVAFLFGNPVEYTSQSDNNEESFNAFKDILRDAKINSFNRKIARDLFSCTEVAELWYPVPVTDAEEKEKFKLKVKKLSVLTGDELYPYFDEYGDLIVFSRRYVVDKVKYFEVYTNETIEKYDITKEPVLVEGYPTPNVLGKIPIVYAVQDETAYYDVEDLIERLEKLISNFADTNDYHAAPKLFVKGIIKGFSKKGESGAIIEGDANTSVEYLSWDNAPEAVRLEIATLKEMIYTISQTPDISFESIKSLGGNAVSGKALRFMFLDAHLKVMDNMEVFDEYLQRRTSIVKAFMTKVRTDMKNSITELEITAQVVPFMIDDIADKLEFVMTATGNKPVLSQKSGIRMAGLVEDAEEELKNIKEEESISVFEPTGL
jgi:SPP1 family phage portal protein